MPMMPGRIFTNARRIQSTLSKNIDKAIVVVVICQMT